MVMSWPTRSRSGIAASERSTQSRSAPVRLRVKASRAAGSGSGAPVARVGAAGAGVPSAGRAQAAAAHAASTPAAGRPSRRMTDHGDRAAARRTDEGTIIEDVGRRTERRDCGAGE